MVFLNYKILDLCGSIVGLSYKGNKRYKSSVGGVLTIFLSISVILLLIIYLNDFFTRTKPNMIFEEIKYFEPPRLNISDKFVFIIMTQFDGINAMRPDIFKVEAQLKYRHNNKWDIKQIESIPCVPSKSIPKELFEKHELYKGECFNMSGVFIEGSNVNDVFEYLQIRFLLCVDESSCYPKDQMPALFETTKPLAMIYFVDTAFQIYNSSNRATDFYHYIDSNLTYNNIKQTNIYFSLNEMLVDENYFFPGTPANYSEFMIESFRDKVSFKTERETEMLLFNFMSSKYKSIIYISYMKISELLANVCALSNLIILFFSTIGNFFNHFFFQSDLINSFYEFDIGNNDDSVPIARDTTQKIQIQDTKIDSYAISQLKLNRKIVNIENRSQKGFSKNIIQRQINRSLNPPNISVDQSGLVFEQKNFNLSLPVTSKLSKSHLDYYNTVKVMLISLVPCLIQKKTKKGLESYNFLSQSLLVYQDLINVYRKLMEIDLLKYILLSEDQLALIQFVPKMLFKSQSELKNSSELTRIVHNPNYHFFKNRKLIREVMNSNPEYKALLMPKYTSLGNNYIQEKLVKLIV